jgi:hypothetical protein
MVLFVQSVHKNQTNTTNQTNLTVRHTLSPVLSLSAIASTPGMGQRRRMEISEDSRPRRVKVVLIILSSLAAIASTPRMGRRRWLYSLAAIVIKRRRLTSCPEHVVNPELVEGSKG